MNDKMLVEIESSTVTLTIKCKDNYAAIILYDSICLNARKGYFSVEVQTEPKAIRSADDYLN